MSAASGSTRRRGLPNLSHSTYESLFGWTYALAAVNACLLVANLPLVAVLFAVVDPLASWPLLLVLGVTVASSLRAAFAVFRAEAEEGSHAPFRAFARAYRTSWRRAGAIGVAALALIGFCLADLVFLLQTPLAPVAGPFFTVLIVVALAVAATAVAGTLLHPGVRVAAVVRAAFAVAVRHWLLSLLSVAALLALAAIALVQPVLGTLLAPAPLLFLVWSNSQVAFARATA
jgi:uncharacterized membrane protein YesL